MIMMLSLAITMLPLVITRQAACDNDDGEPASDIDAAACDNDDGKAACDNVAAACENDDGEAACDEDAAAYGITMLQPRWLILMRKMRVKVARLQQNKINRNLKK